VRRGGFFQRRAEIGEAEGRAFAEKTESSVTRLRAPSISKASDDVVHIGDARQSALREPPAAEWRCPCNVTTLLIALVTPYACFRRNPNHAAPKNAVINKASDPGSGTTDSSLTSPVVYSFDVSQVPSAE
jgi:hypothetical protein